MLKMNYKNFTLVIYVLGLLILSVPSLSEESIPTAKKCDSISTSKSKSKQVFDGASFMIAAAGPETQGESNFVPAYSQPAALCVQEEFDVATLKVSTYYNPWEKGEQTLLYKFVVTSSAEAREITVLYNGMIGLVNKKGFYFYVSEKRKGVISYYAMYREEPSYQAIKELIENILNESVKPLIAVQWPAGAKEPVIDIYDSKRLK